MKHPTVRSPDTSREAQARMEALWRSMSPVDKMAMVDEMTNTCTELAIAGIRHVNPHADQRAVLRELAARRYGDALADEVYGSRSGFDG